MFVFKKSIFVLSLVSGLLLGSFAHADRAEQISTAIAKLQPALTHTETRELTQAFARAEDRGCDIDWTILVSIAFNESSLIKTRVNKQTKDYGLMQINEATIRRLKISKTKALSNPAYAIQKGCEILMWNRDKYAHRHQYWIGLYRSGIALHKKKIRDNAVAYDRIIRKIVAKVERLVSEELASNL